MYLSSKLKAGIVRARSSTIVTTKLKKRIYLRMMIILFFLMRHYRLKNFAFLLPLLVLMITIFYDYFRKSLGRKWMYVMKRKTRFKCLFYSNNLKRPV